jgi:hypothetical protein
MQTPFFYDDVPNALSAKLVPKLKDMNAGAGDLALTDIEFEHVVRAASTLEATSRYHSSEINAAEISALSKMALWDVSKLAIPFDLLRMTACHPLGSLSLSKHPKLPAIIACVAVLLRNTNTSPTVAAVLTRFLVNCFRFDDLRKSLVSNEATVTALHEVLDSCSLLVLSANTNFKLALGSLVANIAATLKELPRSAALYGKVKELSRALLRGDSIPAGLVHCSILALGTIFFYSKEKLIYPELLADVSGVVQEIVQLKQSWTGPVWQQEDVQALAELETFCI